MRVGVIGTNWGRMHIGAFRGAGAQVVALCGRDREKTKRVAAEEHIELFTTSADELIEKVDVVVVASPDREHFWHVGAAAGAGKHVLCEKPLAFTADEAGSLAKLDGPGVRAVCFPYRFLPPMVALKRWLGTKKPLALQASVRNSFAAAPGREASGDYGGCSHLLDAALWLMGGRPLAVHLSTAGAPVHSASFTLELDTGGFASVIQQAAPEPGIYGDWHLSGDGWQATVSGGYHPSLGGWRFGPARIFEHQWFELSPQVAPGQGTEPWAKAHVEVARAFLAACRGEPRGALASFSEGAAVSQLLHEETGTLS